MPNKHVLLSPERPPGFRGNFHPVTPCLDCVTPAKFPSFLFFNFFFCIFSVCAGWRAAAEDPNVYSPVPLAAMAFFFLARCTFRENFPFWGLAADKKQTLFTGEQTRAQQNQVNSRDTRTCRHRCGMHNAKDNTQFCQKGPRLTKFCH